jgi:hypothetical protein
MRPAACSAPSFDGGLRQTLIARPDVFVGTLTEKP